MAVKCTTSFIQELHTRFSTKHLSTPVPVQLPEEIIAEILRRLPVKMLVRCKSVSKSWARLLTDPIFINMHLLHFKSPTRIIPFLGRHSFSISLPLNPNPNSLLNTQRLRPPPCEYGFYLKGYCNGLLVITLELEKSIILWNPSISKYRVLPASPFFENHSSRSLVFSRDICAIGYDSSKDDYKIFASTSFYGTGTRNFEVLSLNSNSWKQLPDAEYAPYKMESFRQPRPVSINGDIFLIVSDKASYEVSHNKFLMIMHFDVCQERVSILPAPQDDSVGNVAWIGDINQSLCTYSFVNKSYFDIWYAKDDFKWVKRENFKWVKLITVSRIPEPNPRTPILYYVPLCFNENGELLISLHGNDIFDQRRGLVAYDRNEQNYLRFVLEENTHWSEETTYRDSLVFHNEPSDQTCSHSSSGSLKKMLLRFSHTILSRFACNATSRKRL